LDERADLPRIALGFDRWKMSGLVFAWENFVRDTGVSPVRISIGKEGAELGVILGSRAAHGRDAHVTMRRVLTPVLRYSEEPGSLRGSARRFGGPSHLRRKKMVRSADPTKKRSAESRNVIRSRVARMGETPMSR
jgi:hypothetical protein